MIDHATTDRDLSPEEFHHACVAVGMEIAQAFKMALSEVPEAELSIEDDEGHLHSEKSGRFVSKGKEDEAATEKSEKSSSTPVDKPDKDSTIVDTGAKETSGDKSGDTKMNPKDWKRGEEPKMTREAFTAIPAKEKYDVGDIVLVWGSFGPIRGVVDSIDTMTNEDGTPVYRVEHPQNNKEGASNSNKTARLIRPFGENS